MSLRFQHFFKEGNPVLLAPLAGVSDSPFRMICQHYGADITYVEMISAAALLHENSKTLAMMARHTEEERLGIQITGRNAKETADAVKVLNRMNFETIDINMGCPVRKVVKTGCGSAILRDINRVYETVARCREMTEKPLSVKIRTGWDALTVNAVSVAKACEAGGCDWLTVHGRTRGADYSVPVDLNTIRKVKESVSIPVLGNGNIFSTGDAQHMRRLTGVDGIMISRGALGNPWIFRQLKKRKNELSLDEWLTTINHHLNLQEESYGDRPGSAIPMRKHLLWYMKGWPGAKKAKQLVNETDSLQKARDVIDSFVNTLRDQGYHERILSDLGTEEHFHWDPKWEMPRNLDNGQVAIQQ